MILREKNIQWGIWCQFIGLIRRCFNKTTIAFHEEVLFHWDNTRSHMYTITMLIFYKLDSELLIHSQYSSDSALIDYFFIFKLREMAPKMKSQSKTHLAIFGQILIFESTKTSEIQRIKCVELQCTIQTYYIEKYLLKILNFMQKVTKKYELPQWTNVWRVR